MRWRAACLWPGRWSSGCGDELHLITEAADSEYFAQKVPDSARGCTWSPPLPGLGAPYWDMYARGALVGADARGRGAIISSRGAGIHRLPDRRCADRDGGRRRGAAARAAGGRRGFCQQFPDAVPGGHHRPHAAPPDDPRDDPPWARRIWPGLPPACGRTPARSAPVGRWTGSIPRRCPKRSAPPCAPVGAKPSTAPEDGRRSENAVGAGFEHIKN